MKEQQKFRILFIAMFCNFAFLLTAQSNRPTVEAMKLPECIKSHGIDSLETRKKMSLFQEDFKNKDNDYAYKAWTYVFNNAPCSYKSIHQNGTILLNRLIDNPANIKRKAGLIDTMLMIFPTRIKYFGEEAFVKSSWAYYLGKFQPEKEKEALDLYQFYYNDITQQNELENFYLRDYLKIAVSLNKKNLLPKDQLFLLYDNMSNTASRYKLKNANDSVAYASWDDFSKSIDRMMASVIKGKDVDLMFLPKIKENPTDIELINKAIKLYKADPLYKDNANYIGLLEKSYDLSPTYASAEGLGRYFEGKKNISKATSYYEKAAELSNDKAQKEDIYLKLAQLNQANTSMLRNYTNKVLQINPNNGKAIITLGKIAYKSQCGSAFDKKMAACVAIDYFQRAKATDGSVTAEANKLIAQFSAYIPTKTEAFFLNLKAGDPYNISCSGESTTIRTK